MGRLLSVPISVITIILSSPCSKIVLATALIINIKLRGDLELSDSPYPFLLSQNPPCHHLPHQHYQSINLILRVEIFHPPPHHPAHQQPVKGVT